VILADVRELSGPMGGTNVRGTIFLVIWVVRKTAYKLLAYRSRPEIRCLQCYTQQQTLSSECKNILLVDTHKFKLTK